MEVSNILQLHTYAMEGILGYLKVKDLLNLSLTCWQLNNEVLESSFFWKQVTFYPNLCPPQEFTNVEWRRKQNLKLKHAGLRTNLQSRRLAFAILHVNFEHIRILNFEGGELECNQFVLAANNGHLKKLRQLSIFMDSHMGYVDIISSKNSLPMLKVLKLAYDGGIGSVEDFIQSILENSPQLYSLKCGKIPHFYFNPVRLDLTKCRNLKELDYYGNDDFATLLNPVLGQLEILKVGDHVYNELPPLPKLRVLDYEGNRVLNITIQRFPCLETVLLRRASIGGVRQTVNSKACFQVKQHVVKNWRLQEFRTDLIKNALVYFQSIPIAMLPTVHVDIKYAHFRIDYEDDLLEVINSRFNKLHLVVTTSFVAYFIEHLLGCHIVEREEHEKGSFIFETSISRIRVDFEEDFFGAMRNLSRRFNSITLKGFEITHEQEQRMRPHLEQFNVKMFYWPKYEYIQRQVGSSI